MGRFRCVQLGPTAKAGIDKSELIFAGFEKNPYYEKLEKLSEECLKDQEKKKIVLWL